METTHRPSPAMAAAWRMSAAWPAWSAPMVGTRTPPRPDGRPSERAAAFKSTASRMTCMGRGSGAPCRVSRGGLAAAVLQPEGDLRLGRELHEFQLDAVHPVAVVLAACDPPKERNGPVVDQVDGGEDPAALVAHPAG